MLMRLNNAPYSEGLMVWMPGSLYCNDTRDPLVLALRAQDLGCPIC